MIFQVTKMSKIRRERNLRHLSVTYELNYSLKKYCGEEGYGRGEL